MAYSFFLKLALNCIHHLAWPLLALGYPLCASVQAIEADSYSQTRDLISYWILLSLIYLFEYAFMKLLSWFHFWPYIKLMIVFWLIIPDFGRASYVYENLVCSCISMKPQAVAVISKLKKWRKLNAKKENFLLHAESYMQESGTEALEKLIVNKIATTNPDAEATKNTISAADKKETQLKECHVQTNGERCEMEHKDIKDLDVIEKKEISAGKQDIPVMPNLSLSQKTQNIPSAIMETNGMAWKDANLSLSQQTQNIPSAMTETNGMARKDTTGGELHQSSFFGEYPGVLPPFLSGNETNPVWSHEAAPPNAVFYLPGFRTRNLHQSSTHKEVQKEWTCALCQVTTSSEKNLISHLLGRKHKATCEALKAKHQPVPVKLKNDRSKEELKQKNIITQLANIEQKNIPISRKKDHAQLIKELQKSMHNVPVKQINIKGQENKSTRDRKVILPVPANNRKNGESVTNNNNGLKGKVVINHVKPVQGQQKNPKKHVIFKNISKLRCEAANNRKNGESVTNNNNGLKGKVVINHVKPVQGQQKNLKKPVIIKNISK